MQCLQLNGCTCEANRAHYCEKYFSGKGCGNERNDDGGDDDDDDDDDGIRD